MQVKHVMQVKPFWEGIALQQQLELLSLDVRLLRTQAAGVTGGFSSSCCSRHTHACTRREWFQCQKSYQDGFNCLTAYHACSINATAFLERIQIHFIVD